MRASTVHASGCPRRTARNRADARRSIGDSRQKGQTVPPQSAEKAALPTSMQCERGDSNPHGGYPLDPKSSASASSATPATRL